MASPDLAVSIISFKRNHLLDLCLLSVKNAMVCFKYPVYVLVQDPSPEDELILDKYRDLISKIIRVWSDGRNVEELINANRSLAWKYSLVDLKHDYSICLEDDVEISRDFFTFTEKVLEINKNEPKFKGLNYGSFETNVNSGGFSKKRYGIHGPASLITRNTLEEFELNKLAKVKGKIAWDSWVEPITKMGYMATSNVARYRDNGINGTHTSSDFDNEYFRGLNSSFQYGANNPTDEVCLEEIPHSWRRDCVPYTPSDDLEYIWKKFAIRLHQYLNLFFAK